MGKAAKNEEIKLTATFFNNLALGVLLGGAFIPYLAVFQSEKMATGTAIVNEFLAGNISHLGPVFLKLFAFFLAFVTAFYFRHVARRNSKTRRLSCSPSHF